MKLVVICLIVVKFISSTGEGDNSAKIVQYSYNVAGLFRTEHSKSAKSIAFRKKVMNDVMKNASGEAWMYIFSYQEIWNACNVGREQLNNIADIFVLDLKKKVFLFTEGVMKEAFSDRKDKIVCRGGRNQTLMTVACRFFSSPKPPKEEWFKSAFKYGWSEFGGKTNYAIMGFKGILGVSIALGDNKSLLVVNVHLSSKNLQDRWKGIRVMKDLVQPYLASNEFAVLMVGDFNARSFSLVSPSIAHKQLADFEKNVGAAFLLLCLTGTVSDNTFNFGDKKYKVCTEVLQKAKEFDQISYFFNQEFPAAREAMPINFKPTFCFNFESQDEIKPYLAPKKGESIPSFTDRIFYVNAKGLELKWSKYVDIPGPSQFIEYSDHRPVIGVFTIDLDKSSQSKFIPATAFKEAKTLPSEDEKVKFNYRKAEDKSWRYPTQPNPYHSPPREFQTFQISNYKKVHKVDHNAMLSKAHLQGYLSFIGYADKMFSSIKEKEAKKKLIEELKGLAYNILRHYLI